MKKLIDYLIRVQLTKGRNIPTGATDSLQPLDIRVNGVLKTIGDKKKTDLLDALNDQPIGITNSISILIDIWDNIISTDTIQESWAIYIQKYNYKFAFIKF